MRPGKHAELVKFNPLAIAEKIKASVRAKVEHSFFYMKRVFGYNKVRYRGLAKNANRFYVLAGLTKPVRMKRVKTKNWESIFKKSGHYYD